jgi:hypothetical protein
LGSTITPYIRIRMNATTVYKQLATNHYEGDHDDDEDDDEHLIAIPLDPMPYDELIRPTSPVPNENVVHEESESSTSPNGSTCTSSHPRPPCNYICPLTLQLMNEPMNDGCGHCFDRDAIVAWLEYHEMCPISRKPITRRELRPSRALRRRIRDWKRLHDYNEKDGDHEDEAAVELTTCTNPTYYPRNETYSPMELILLPQERKVLGAIKIRAHALRRQRRKERIIWSIGGGVVGVIVIALTFMLRNIGGEFQGPI